MTSRKTNKLQFDKSSSFTTRIKVLAFSFIFLLVSLTTQIAYAQTIVGSINVKNNNVSGGGFQSDVTITDDGLTVYSSADVSGISKSINGGLIYKSVSEGLKSPKVASLAITPDNENILYAGTGNQGNSGGLFRSVNAGDSWELTGDGGNAQFSGNHSDSNDPVPDGHPRSNGDLIVVVEGANAATFTDDIVIAGTYKDGVLIFIQGGEVQASAVDTSGFVRAVAYNSVIPNTAFAAMQFHDSSKNGIYKIDFTDPFTASSSLVYPTLRPEGITILGSGNVYSAVSTEGIVKFDGSSWSNVSAGLSTNNDNRQWTAVTGYLKGIKDVVYAGTNNMGGTVSGVNYSNIWRTKDGGVSWIPLVLADSNVSDQILGKSYDWWFRTKAFPQAGLGRKNSVVSTIAVAQGAKPLSVFDDIIYVSGRGGIWKSDDGGRSWKPAVYNMQVTSNNSVAVNPNDPAQVAMANTDFVVIETGSRFRYRSISRDKPDGAESKGYDVVFDAVSNELIVGVGDRDSNNPGGGEVFVKAADAVGDPSDAGWTNTNLASVTSLGDGNAERVRAITYGYHDGTSASSQTILAAVEGEGVYRYHSGTWLKSNGISIGSTERSDFLWPDNTNSGVVYLLDLTAGFYRSNDGGINWENSWPSMSFNNNDFFNSGYLTAHDADPTTLFLSIQGRAGSPIGTSFKVYRMSNAAAGIFGSPTADTSITDVSFHSGTSQIKRPGPIALGADGRLWLTQQQNSANSIDAGLFVMENPKTDGAFRDVTTNKYRNIAIQPSGIDVASDKTIYISQSGKGLVKIRYRLTSSPIIRAENESPYFVEQEETQIKFYPNPFRDQVVLDSPNNEYEVFLSDVYGRRIPLLIKGGIINTRHLSPGVYLLSLIMEEKLTTYRLVKEN